MKPVIYTILTMLLTSIVAQATPSSTYWAPSTASCQGWNVPHVTYDSYFRNDADYATDYGLTTGFLPFEKIQGEIGFDLLYPSADPEYLNAKLCTPESSLFEGSPAVGFGAYSMGFKHNVTDYNILYLVLQKSIPNFGGSVALGAYNGLNKDLFVNSDGKKVQSGLLAAVTSPDVMINRKGLKKINFVADIQTGKNAFGAWGVGSNIYFADNVSLLTGPVFFFDKDIQPGGSDTMWTLQLDIDIPLDK